MVKYSFVFFIVFLIGLLSFFFQSPAISVVPGWHTTLYSPWFLVTLIPILWLGIVSMIYKILERNRKVVQHRIFLLHIIFSVFVFAANVFVYFDNYYLTRALLIAPYFLFTVGQIVFVVGVLKAKKRDTNLTG